MKRSYKGKNGRQVVSESEDDDNDQTNMILAQQRARRDKARLEMEGEILISSVNHDDVALSRFF